MGAVGVGGEDLGGGVGAGSAAAGFDSALLYVMGDVGLTVGRFGARLAD